MVSVKSTTLQAVAAAVMTAAMALCTGCSRDETSTVPDRRVPIRFSPGVSRQPSTRSVAHIDEASFSAFDVWAFGSNNTSDDRWDMGTDGSRGFQISRDATNGVMPGIVGSQTGIWGYTDIRQLSYWPFDGSQEMRFYAVSPSTVLGSPAVKGLELAMTRRGHGFTYTPPETRHADGTYSHGDQRDIIVAASNVALSSLVREGQSLPRMTVPLQFRPALASIVFDARLETGVRNFKVVIKSIALCNIFTSGTCTLSADDGKPSWEGLERGTVTLTPGGTAGVTLETSDGANFTASCGGGPLTDTKIPLSNGSAGQHTDDNIMVVPQTVTPWAATGSLPVPLPADGDGHAYLKIGCEITQNGHSLLAQEYVYVPLLVQTVQGMADGVTDTGWQPGIEYTYTLHFGLGFDDAGRLNGTPITFTVTAGSDWTQSQGDISL